MLSAMLTQRELEQKIDAGDIDTVIVAFADMQGRLTGKRVAARLFVEEVAKHGAECCNYLLAVDVEMNTVDGYAMSSWDTGYGDMVMTPDFATLRRIPWLRGAAKHPGAPDHPARRARPGALCGHRARVHGVRQHLSGGVVAGIPRADA